MRTVLVIGIGTGNPDHLTLQAVAALARVDVFFVTDKGESTHELLEHREALIERHADGHPHRTVEISDPPRDRETDAYLDAVSDWHAARAQAWADAFRGELAEDGVGAFLVWGDPSLYDSTLGILERVREGGLEFACEVIPGITSVQALAASHALTLNRVGGAIQITTGRRLRDEGFPTDADDVVVLLDGELSFRSLDAAQRASLEVFWGAYLGMPQEEAIHGDLEAVSEAIVAARSAARERYGWIMDAYLLRRRMNS